MEAQAREGWAVTVMLGRFSDVCQQQAGVIHVLRTMASIAGVTQDSRRW